MLFNETYNRVNHLTPSIQESKQMIHEVGNIELCELLDMEPKAQCKVCLPYWDVGIVHCTCGHFLLQYTMDPLSVPNYYIKKGQCKKKFYLGIHDRFIRDEKFRKNMFDAARTVKNLSRIGERRPYAPPDSRRNSRIQSQTGGFETK